MSRRQGFSLVESLFAMVLVVGLAGTAAMTVWSSSRQTSLLEIRERTLAAASSRLEMVTGLPLHRRPNPGTYQFSEAPEDSDLARVLAPKSLGGVSLEFTLVVEEHPVEYPDYFFGGGSVKHIDFRLYRLRSKSENLEIELVTLR